MSALDGKICGFSERLPVRSVEGWGVLGFGIAWSTLPFCSQLIIHLTGISFPGDARERRLCCARGGVHVAV
jgi:hypothetical protein